MDVTKPVEPTSADFKARVNSWSDRSHVAQIEVSVSCDFESREAAERWLLESMGHVMRALRQARPDQDFDKASTEQMEMLKKAKAATTSRDPYVDEAVSRSFNYGGMI